MRFYAAAILVFLLSARPAYTQEETVISAEANHIINAVIKARESLASGIFQASISKTTIKEHDNFSEELSSELRCSFDIKTNRWRKEVNGEKRATIASSSELTAETIQQIKNKTFTHQPERLKFTAMYVRNPEYLAEWYATGESPATTHYTCHIQLMPPDASMRDRSLMELYPQSTGLCNQREYTLGKTPREVFDDYFLFVKQVDGKTDSEGIALLTLTYDEQERSIAIDSKNGWTPISMSTSTIDLSGKRTIMEDTTAKWEERDGVWVPIATQIISIRPGGEIRDTHIDFEWTSVNPVSISNDVFTYQSFQGVWDGTKVLERRDGSDRHIDTIGEKHVEILPERIVKQPLQQRAHAQQRNNFLIWLIVANSIVAAMIVVIFLYRRK